MVRVLYFQATQFYNQFQGMTGDYCTNTSKHFLFCFYFKVVLFAFLRRYMSWGEREREREMIPDYNSLPGSYAIDLYHTINLRRVNFGLCRSICQSVFDGLVFGRSVFDFPRASRHLIVRHQQRNPLQGRTFIGSKLRGTSWVAVCTHFQSCA